MKGCQCTPGTNRTVRSNILDYQFTTACMWLLYTYNNVFESSRTSCSLNEAWTEVHLAPIATRGNKVRVVQNIYYVPHATTCNLQAFPMNHKRPSFVIVPLRNVLILLVNNFRCNCTTHPWCELHGVLWHVFWSLKEKQESDNRRLMQDAWRISMKPTSVFPRQHSYSRVYATMDSMAWSMQLHYYHSPSQVMGWEKQE